MARALAVRAAPRILLFDRRHPEELRRVDPEPELTEVQLRNIEMPMHPHFLFDTMNTIAGPDNIRRRLAAPGAQAWAAWAPVFCMAGPASAQAQAPAEEPAGPRAGCFRPRPLPALPRFPWTACLVLLAGCGGAGALAAPAAPSPLGHWEGELRFRGDVWPLRVHLSRQGDSVAAALDLPELGMAWQPTPARLRGDSLSLEVPFGLGTLTGVPRGDSLHAHRVTSSGDTLRLAAARGPAFPMVREEVRFRNGPATLAGVLVKPAGGGPHPAVVLVHGSAAQGRGSWGYRSTADFLVRNGYAALYYDKRGVGESTGDWMRTSFPDVGDLADDLVAAVRFLEARPDVDASRTGIFGGSQALWVGALAASRSEGIDFMVMRGAPAVTPAEQEIQRVRHTMAGEFDTAAVREALEHTRLYLSVVETGEGWDRLRASVQRVRAAPWAEHVLQADAEDDLHWWRRNHDVDPAPLLRSLRVPVLLLYGEDDTVVPPRENAPEMRRLLSGTDLTVVTFPRASHAVEVPAGPDPSGRWRFPRKAPGYFDAIRSWLGSRVTSPGVPPPPPDTLARACADAGYRQFDFWLGRWSVRRPGGEPMAVNEISRAAQGCAVQERYHTASGYTGASLNLYDPGNGGWTQLWVDNGGLVLHLAGGLDGQGRMVLSGERTSRDGSRVRDRITWAPLPDGTVRQVWDGSRDGGKTWENAFTGECVPLRE